MQRYTRDVRDKSIDMTSWQVEQTGYELELGACSHYSYHYLSKQTKQQAIACNILAWKTTVIVNLEVFLAQPIFIYL